MDKIIKILKKIKIRNILILIILLAFNTYAWFIYTTKVSAQLTAHVSAWDVQFVAKDGGVTSNALIVVERICPGMETFEHIIEVKNRGEVNVQLGYDIQSLKIMDEYYEASDTSGLTSQDLETKMLSEYPFKIKIEKDDTNLITGTGDGQFKITVEWPFESGNVELDTYYGNKAYQYYSTNPGTNAIELSLTLKASQTAWQ